MRRLALAGLVLGIGAWLAPAASAATFTVNSTADTADPCAATCTLRAAIRAANASAGTDEVVLPAGTFALTLNGSGDNAAASGDLDVTDSVTIRGAGADKTTIDGAGLTDESMFDVNLSGSGKAAFEDLRLANADESSDPAVVDSDTASLEFRRAAVTGNDGEQIIAAGSTEGAGTLLIEGSTIGGNRADDQLIDASPDEAGTLIIRDSAISDNEIFSDEVLIDQEPGGDAAVLTIERSSFERNATVGGKGEDGEEGLLLDFTPITNGELATTVRVSDSRFADNLMGVLRFDPETNGDLDFDARVERTTFARNVSDREGAAILSNPSAETGDGDLVVRDSTFADNEARGGFTAGGAIYSAPSLTTGTLDVAGSTFSGNEAAAGGAIVIQSGDMVIDNSTFSGNEVVAGEGDAVGGAIAIFDPFVPARLTHVTIAGNRVIGTGEGGGIYTQSRFQEQRAGLGAEPQQLTVVNSIVAGNTVADEPEDCSDPALSEGNNIEGATSCGFDGAGDKQNADPRLGALADNGGPTQTRAIGKDSPAFDSADAEFCPAADQRGVKRPQFAGCDIGAFELAAAAPTQPTTTTTQPAASAPAAQGGVLGTSSRKCVSRRRFRIKLRVPRGERVVKAVVRVNGKRVLVRRGTRLTSTVNLRGLPRGRFRVQIKLTLASGKTISGTRRYGTCTPAINDGVPPEV